MSERDTGSIGQIFDGTFLIYREHYATLIATAALANCLPVVARIVWPPLASVLGGIGSTLGLVALTSQVSETLLGRRPGLGSGLWVGVRRFFPVLLSVLCLLVMIAAPALLVGAIAWFAMPARSGLTPGTFAVLVVLLAMLWVALIAVLSLRYFALVQVATLEPGASPLDRSALLARGAYGRIALVTLGSFVIYAAPGLVLALWSGMLGALERTGQPARVAALIVAVGIWVLTSLLAPFGAALSTLLYYDRRIAKDGLELVWPHAPVAAPGVPVLDPSPEQRGSVT